MAKLDNSKLVKKIVLGRSENARHAFPPGKIKIQHATEAGLKLKAYTGNGVMDVFVVFDKEHSAAVLELIENFLA